MHDQPRSEPLSPGSYYPKDLHPILPRRVPRLGVTLFLGSGQWRYTNEPRPLMLLVTCVRLDISQGYSGDWVWLEGDELAPGDVIVGRVQALVHVTAIPDSALAGG